MKKIKCFFVIIFVLNSLFLSFCEESSISKSVCILYYDSHFKQELLNRLEKELVATNFSVVTDNIKNYNKYPATKYNAVILLSATEKFGPIPAAREYIVKQNYSPNIIYFSSYDKFNMPYGFILEGPDRNKIDVITAATVTYTEQDITIAKDKVMKRLQQIIK